MSVVQEPQDTLEAKIERLEKSLRDLEGVVNGLLLATNSMNRSTVILAQRLEERSPDARPW